jgi:hypothetical protein
LTDIINTVGINTRSLKCHNPLLFALLNTSSGHTTLRCAHTQSGQQACICNNTPEALEGLHQLPSSPQQSATLCNIQLKLLLASAS